jgi:hypothetical protein
VPMRCPCCHANLVAEVVLAVAPQPTLAERIDMADPEVSGRQWALDVERDQLAELEDEQRRGAGMSDEPGRGQ